MADLGDMIARLMLDSSSWTESMKKVGDDTERETTKVEGAFGKIGGALAGIGAAMAGFEIGKKVLEFGEDAVHAAGQILQMERAMTNLVGPGQKVAEFVERIDTIADKSPFEFKDLAPAAQKMIQLGASMDQVEKTIQGIADMGTALGKSGGEVSNIASSVARLASAADPMRTLNQLEREGLPIWEELAKTLGTSVVSAQEQVKKGAISNQEILASLTDSFAKYHDAAVAWGNTWKGSMKAVNESTENVMEAVGKSIIGMLNAIAPLLREVAGLIQDFADWWGKLPTPVQNAVVAVGGLLAALTALGGIVALVGAAVALIPASITALVAPIALAVGALVALTAAFVALGTWVNEHWDGITKALTGAWDQLKTIWEGTWNDISSVLTGIWNGIKSAAESILGSVTAAVAVIWEAVKAIWNTAWDGIVAVVKGYWNALLGALSIFDKILSYLSPFWDPIKDAFKAAWDWISSYLGTAWEKIASTVGIVWGAITKIIGSEVDAQVTKAKETQKQLDDQQHAMEEYAKALKGAGVSSTADLQTQLAAQEAAIGKVKETLKTAAEGTVAYQNAKRDLVVLEEKHRKSLEELNDPLGLNAKATKDAAEAAKKYQEELTAMARESKPIKQDNTELALSLGAVTQAHETLRKEMHDAQKAAADLAANGFDKIAEPVVDAQKGIETLTQKLTNFTGVVMKVPTAVGAANDALKKMGVESTFAAGAAAELAREQEDLVKSAGGMTSAYDKAEAHANTLRKEIDLLTRSNGDHREELDRLETELANTEGAISRMTQTTTGAYHAMGMATRTELDNMAANAQANYEKIASDANASAIQVQEAWVQKTQATYQQILQEGGKLTQDQKSELDRQKQQIQDHLNQTPSMWKTAYDGAFQAVGGAVDNMIDKLVTGKGSFKEIMNGLWTDMAETALHTFLDPLKDAIQKFIANEIADLLSGKGLGGIIDGFKNLGQTVSDVFSTITGATKTVYETTSAAGGLATDVAGVAGDAAKTGADVAGTAGKAAASSVTGIVGAVSGVVSAISSVIGNFQMAKQETSLNAIEHNTRYTMMYVGERADGGILGVLFKIDEEIAWGFNTKATENMRDILKDGLNQLIPLAASVESAVVNGIAPYMGAIKSILEDIRDATLSTARGVSEVNISVQASGLTTAEAARALGNQIAKNLTTQMAPVTA